MLIDVTPLKNYRDFRLLFIGQLVSFFGSMITYVALPYQVYELTGSSWVVGMIGIAQLVPLLVFAFVGGAYADAMDRRRLLLVSEAALMLASLVLVLNARLARPELWVIFAVAAVMSVLNGFHRPALTALTPRLVDRAELPAVSALSSLQSNLGMIGGPAVGGISIAALGLPATYLIDVASFGISLVALACIRAMPAPEHAEQPSLRRVLEGLRYAKSRQELLGTYIVDIVAMVFGMPMALFPAIAKGYGGADVVGWLYSAPSIGALAATLLSGWTKNVKRHGAAVILAAAVWGIAITGFGLAPSLWTAILFLSIAGAADMVSGIFRLRIWNETIPDRLRGRMAGIEMISYTSGPLLGNAEAGMVAAALGTAASIVSGGLFCVAGVGLCIGLLPEFWAYKAGAPSSRPPSP